MQVIPTNYIEYYSGNRCIDKNHAKTALDEMEYKVIQIMNVRNRASKEKSFLFSNSNNGDMYNIKKKALLHVVARFETPYRKQMLCHCKR